MKKQAYKTIIDNNTKDIMTAIDTIIQAARAAVSDSELTLAEMSEIIDKIRLLEYTDFTRDLSTKVFE